MSLYMLKNSLTVVMVTSALWSCVPEAMESVDGGVELASTSSSLTATPGQIEACINPLLPNGTRYWRPISAALSCLANLELGDPYVEFATGPDRFDCSGLTAWLFNEVNYVYGVNGKPTPLATLIHSAKTQCSGGTKIAKGAQRAGDLVCFTSGSAVSGMHVGISLGGNRYIEALKTGTLVQISLNPEAKTSFVDYRRYTPN